MGTAVQTVFGSLLPSIQATPPQGATSFSSILKLIDGLQYTLYLNGPRLEESEKFLAPFRTNPLEIFGNPFETDEDNLECEASQNFLKEDVSCYFLNNYGEDTMIILAVFIGAVVLKLLMTLKKKWEKFRWLKWFMNVVLFFPARIFNFDFFSEIVDGSQIEMFQSIFLNFKYRQNNKYLNIGLIVSIIFLLLYCIYAWVLFMVGWNKFKISGGQQPIFSSKILKNVEPFVGYLYEDFKSPKELRPIRFVYLIPFLLLCKSAAIQLALVFLAERGMNQVKVIMLFELLFLIISIFFQTKKTKMAAFVNRIVSLCFFLIQIVVLLSSYFSGIIKKSVFGWTLVGIYSVILLIEFIKFLSENAVLLWIVLKYAYFVLRGKNLKKVDEKEEETEERLEPSIFYQESVTYVEMSPITGVKIEKRSKENYNKLKEDKFENNEENQDINKRNPQNNQDWLIDSDIVPEVPFEGLPKKIQTSKQSIVHKLDNNK